MPTISYKDLVTKLRKEIWPGGEAPNLRSAHDSMFLAAFVDLQNSVPELQKRNVTVHPFCSTYVDCAKTLIPAPIGEIRHLYTLCNDNWCDPVFYDWRNKGEVDGFAYNNLIPIFTASASTVKLPKGVKLASSESDSVYGRARTGTFAMESKKIWVAPWIQSNESVVVEWDGVKKMFVDTDVLDQDWWDVEAEQVLEAFVHARHFQRYGHDRAEAADARTHMIEIRALFIIACQEKTRMRDVSAPNSRRLPITAELTNDKDFVEVNQAITIWQTADSSNTANTQLVADLIAAGSPALIVHAGDISYDDVAYASVVEAYYDKSKFRSCPGNHDWAFDDLVPYIDYFDYPNNERYYEYVIGSCHFFFGDSDVQEPDGIAITTSEQWEWLNSRVRLSPARWKIVVLHHTPYSSGTTHGGNVAMRWDFKAMGVDLVIAGHEHNYEHLKIGDLDYLVNGLGGRSIYPFGAPVSGSLTRYNAKYGAVKFTISCTKLAWSFISVDNDVIDTVEITK